MSEENENVVQDNNASPEVGETPNEPAAVQKKPGHPHAEEYEQQRGGVADPPAQVVEQVGAQDHAQGDHGDERHAAPALQGAVAHPLSMFSPFAAITRNAPSLSNASICLSAVRLSSLSPASSVALSPVSWSVTVA